MQNVNFRAFTDHPGELRLPRSDAHWHRLPHTKWRRARCHLHWCWRSRCCRCYGRNPLGAEMSKGYKNITAVAAAGSPTTKNTLDDPFSSLDPSHGFKVNVIGRCTPAASYNEGRNAECKLYCPVVCVRHSMLSFIHLYLCFRTISLFVLVVVIAFLACFFSGDWCEADGLPVRLDISQGCYPEGGWHPDSEGWHWSHCRVPRSRG